MSNCYEKSIGWEKFKKMDAIEKSKETLKKAEEALEHHKQFMSDQYPVFPRRCKHRHQIEFQFQRFPTTLLYENDCSECAYEAERNRKAEMM